MSGQHSRPTNGRDLKALLKKLEHDPDALELVARLIEKLATSKVLPRKHRRSIQSE